MAFEYGDPGPKKRRRKPAGGWRWRVTTYFKDTGMVATQTVHNCELARDLEVEAARRRGDIGEIEIEEA